MTDPTSTSTTIDPQMLFQRVYHTNNAGIPPWVFVIVFVMLIVVILAMALALSRNPR